MKKRNKASDVLHETIGELQYARRLASQLAQIGITNYMEHH